MSIWNMQNISWTYHYYHNNLSPLSLHASALLFLSNIYNSYAFLLIIVFFLFFLDL